MGGIHRVLINVIFWYLPDETKKSHAYIIMIDCFRVDI
jgi:hypothetical protein